MVSGLKGSLLIREFISRVHENVEVGLTHDDLSGRPSKLLMHIGGLSIFRRISLPVYALALLVVLASLHALRTYGHREANFDAAVVSVREQAVHSSPATEGSGGKIVEREQSLLGALDVQTEEAGATGRLSSEPQELTSVAEGQSSRDEQLAGPRRLPAVVVAAHAEDTSWLQGIGELCGVEILVYQSKDPNAPHYIKNLGGEAGKYFQAMLDMWDSPPPYSLFIHAHNTSWHNKVSASEFICSREWRTNSSQVSVNGFRHFPSIRVMRVVQRRAGRIEAVFIRDRDVTSKKWFATNNLRQRVQAAVSQNRIHVPTGMFDSECCSQFIITGELLRRRPKAFYHKLLRWAMTPGDSIRSKKNQLKPTVEKVKGFEPLWPVIFSVEPPLGYAKFLPGSFARQVSVAKRRNR